MLKLRFTNNKQNAVWLVEPLVTIGRSPDCDLVLEGEGVADLHAEIRVEHEQLTLRLLVDADNTFLNGKLVPMATPMPLEPADNLRIGRVAMQVVDPKREPRPAVNMAKPDPGTGWALKANHSALGNRVFPLKNETLVGRSADCDITLAAAHLSRRHAQLTVRDGLLYVRDIESANGTFLNGRRIKEARVRRGDDLRFDTLSFGVIGPADDLDKTSVRGPEKHTGKVATKQARPGVRPVAARNQEERDLDVAVQSGGNAVEASAAPAAGMGRVVGLGLLVLIAGGVYVAFQNGLF